MPRPVRLAGRYLVLEPLTADHADHLFAALGGEANESLWTYRGDEPPCDIDAWRDRIAHRPEGWVTFAIRPEAGTAPATCGPANGMASLLRAHVFDELGYRR